MATAAWCSTGGSRLCCSAMAGLLQNGLIHSNRNRRIALNMKAEHRATQIAAMGYVLKEFGT